VNRTDPDDTLALWHAERLVGRLWRNTAGEIGFSYVDEWIEGDGFAVSRSLPRTQREFAPEGGSAHRWFANLLPEGSVRDRIVRDLKIANTDFELLRAIGGECAGALSVLPVDEKPTLNWRYQPLEESELVQLVARRGQIYASGPADERPRLSLAGAQDKCPILLRDGRYFLPQGEAPSSHILKFETRDYRHVPAYETFTTDLADAIGLPTAEVTLEAVGRTRYVCVTRYDRLRNDDGVIRRLHQEDFCQALGYGHERKYQEHGGPSFSECFRLVQEASSEPAIDTQYLLRWQIFNLLSGNSDGHAKNLSLLHLPDKTLRLAPFYDLVCTRAIERIDERLAMDVGGERDPRRITRAHWEGLAKECGVRPSFLVRWVQETSDSLQTELDPSHAAFEKRNGPYPALQRVVGVVRSQCQRQARQISGTR
jgi:serine/threonine-protein kinase HipA